MKKLFYKTRNTFICFEHLSLPRHAKGLCGEATMNELNLAFVAQFLPKADYLPILYILWLTHTVLSMQINRRMNIMGEQANSSKTGGHSKSEMSSHDKVRNGLQLTTDFPNLTCPEVCQNMQLMFA